MQYFRLMPQFGYVTLTVIGLCLECQLTSIIFGARQRNVFNAQFMKDNFGEEHMKMTGKEIGSGGMPDSGSGYYANKLSYQDWYNYNNAVRVHMNFVEWLPMMISFLLIAGIHFPIPAAIIGVVLMIARMVYSIGYTTYGPPGRIPGFLMTLLSVLALGALGVISSIYLIKSFEF